MKSSVYAYIRTTLIKTSIRTTGECSCNLVWLFFSISVPASEEQTQLVKINHKEEKWGLNYKRDPLKFSIPDNINPLKEFESELMLDNIYLSMLLRRHCQDGAFKNFEYLLRTRILEKKEGANVQQILTSRDKNGYTLLHCAAVGGSLNIFKAIINAGDEIKVHETTYDGLTVLHIACKNKNLSLCRFLMFENDFKKLLLHKKSNKGWNAAHYAAAVGSIEILNLLKDHGLDITVATENKLNILDIACLHNQADLCKCLINRDGLCLSLDKADENGWTIVHIAAMVGNKDIFDCLIEKNVNIEVKTKQQKTVLHISSEYGNYDVCMKILKDYSTIVYDKDEEDWNALHYAAKGGNLKLYKKVENFFKKRTHLCEITRDERTVLHIACINKSIEICKYICNEKSYEGIINSKGEFKDWTAAHYVAVEIKQDGTEEKLIRMLVKSGIDLKAVTTDGLTVLGVACEHRNRNLIKFLLKNHNELLGVGKPYLKNAAKASNDENIEFQVKEALKNYKGKQIDIIAKKNLDVTERMPFHQQLNKSMRKLAEALETCAL